MKNKFLILIFIIFFILSSSILILSQDLIKERPDLKEEIMELSGIFNDEESDIENVEFTVYQFEGTVDEALIYAEEKILTDDINDFEIEKSTENISEMIAGIRNLSEYGIISSLDQEWIEASKVEEEKMKDVKQTVYYGELEYSNLEKEISIENPFFNPVTFRLESGTYIIYSEIEYKK
jgi:hypothetical protein